MSYANAASAYRENAILTASAEKIVLLLYEGAIRHLERSRLFLSDPATVRSAQAGESIGRALAIVSELRASLDHNVGGEVSKSLERLYEFTEHQITQANISRTPAPLESGLRVMRTLKEAWDVVIPH
jgi:flagellar protein FliS